jgi:ABC-type nitrate/sulfonate/bicarbonate transport system ATPase subunit
MLAGLEHPTPGRILIGGKDVTMLPANERDVSMVFQSYALFPHMSVLENVAYGLESSKMKKNEARERAEEGLKQVGLAGYGQRLPAELSGGQQQRVAVARALVLEPQVLLLDEPLSNLDARLRRRVRTEIRELQQRLGFTAVYVTHDQEEALAVSDRIIVMQDGVVAQQVRRASSMKHPPPLSSPTSSARPMWCLARFCAVMVAKRSFVSASWNMLFPGEVRTPDRPSSPSGRMPSRSRRPRAGRFPEASGMPPISATMWNTKLKPRQVRCSSWTPPSTETLHPRPM